MSKGHKKPKLVILAGGNGAGKSTFYRLYLKPRGIPFINADEIARELWPGSPEEHSYQAMLLAEETRREALAKGCSFCFETVFSHESKIEFLRCAREQGFEVHIYVIHLRHPQTNVGRVEQRVSEGGHTVPPEKIVSRIPRTLANLKKAVPLADRLVLLDNSRYDQPYLIQAKYIDGVWSEIAKDIAPWAREFVEK